MACAAVGGCEPTKLRVTAEQECLACSSTTCTYIHIYIICYIKIQTYGTIYTRARVNQQGNIIKYTYNTLYFVVVEVAVVVDVVRIMQGHHFENSSTFGTVYMYIVKYTVYNVYKYIIFIHVSCSDYGLVYVLNSTAHNSRTVSIQR